jgi:hypothetical protein
MTDYSIESLCALFQEHAIKADEQRQKSIESFRENYPNESLPEHFSCDFNIAHALGIMAEEISKLKHITSAKSGWTRP